MNFSGKVALITGGSHGIGRAYANALLNIGMKVCICDIHIDAAKDFIEHLPENLRNNAIYQKCDVSSFTDLKEAFDKTIATFGTLDVLINNAGMFSETKYQDMININFIAVVRGTLLAFEHMNKLTGGKGGYVINTSSEAGLDSFPIAPVYSATKHAVVGLTKSLGSDYHYEKTGITVNVICPGPVETAFFKAFPSNCVYPEEAWKLQASMKPVKPEDVAKALLKLLEDNKNGAVLRIDTEGLRYV